MSALLALTVRYLAGRRLRTGLTTLAIVFGVAVVFGVNLVLPTFVASIEGAVVGVTGQADLTVSGASGEPFGSDVLGTVESVSGVAAASPSLRRQLTFGVPGDTAAQTVRYDLVGVDPSTAPLVRKYQLQSGRELESGDSQSAVLTNGLAWALGLSVGDTISVPTPSGLVTLNVVGVVYGEEEQVIVPLSLAQQAFDQSGRVNRIDVALAAGASRDAVKDDLAARLGPDFDVGAVSMATDALSTVEMGLLVVNVIGVLTIFMSGFLIFNTFRTSVVERQHDIGVLRSVGATRRTVVALVLTESTLQGVIGTALGLALGYGFAAVGVRAMQGLLDQYLRVRVTGVVVTPTALGLAVGLGIGVSVLAGLLPALAASRTSIIAALRPRASGAVAERRGLTRGAIAGLILVALSAATAIIGNPSAAGLGAFLFLGGLVCLAPSLVRPVAALFAAPLSLLGRGEGRLAQGNLQRQPSRSAVTASAVMIALAIVIGASSLLGSIQSGFSTYVDKTYPTDFLILPPTLALWGSEVGLDPTFESKLASVPGVGDWASIRYAGSEVNGETIQVLAFDPVAYAKVAGLTLDQGDSSTYAALGQGRNAVVNPLLASVGGLKVGDDFELRTPDGPRTYRVVGIGNDYLSAKVNTLYISQANLAADFHKQEDIIVLANRAPGASYQEAEAGIQSLLKDYPQVSLYSGEAWREAQRHTLDQIVYAMVVVLVVLAIPSLLGLINTLAIGVLERTREIGVLRAVGATRPQVQSLILSESLLLCALGAVLGIVGGLALGYGMIGAVSAQLGSVVAFSFPIVGIAMAVVAAVAMGVLASLVPGRQAARLRIVQALQYE